MKGWRCWKEQADVVDRRVGWIEWNKPEFEIKEMTALNKQRNEK